MHAAIDSAAAGWELYLIYPLDDQAVFICSKRERCFDPGKHPAMAHGFNDASSDPERIREMFSRRFGANVSLRTGRGSDVS